MNFWKKHFREILGFCDFSIENFENSSKKIKRIIFRDNSEDFFIDKFGGNILRRILLSIVDESWDKYSVNYFEDSLEEPLKHFFNAFTNPWKNIWMKFYINYRR